MKKLFFIFIIIMITSLSNVYASEPLTILKGEIDEILSILNDEKYKDDRKKDEQQTNLWKVVNGIFNFEVMSRLALATNWRDFSPDQQNEFAEVFGKFLGKNYLVEIQSRFSGEQVEYVGEDMITDEKAVVMTNIIKSNVKIPVNYSMLKQENTWKIYDVKIEGISLLNNYRSQFRSILLKQKPDHLIDSLKNKLQ